MTDQRPPIRDLPWNELRRITAPTWPTADTGSPPFPPSRVKLPDGFQWPPAPSPPTRDYSNDRG